MKNIRRIALGFMLGLSIAMSGAAFAQNPAPEKKSESCCAKESCCCKGDSCKMKSGSMNHARDKHEAGCGDSCSMKKDGATKSDKHECCGDSCSIEKQGAAGTTASEKREYCCGGDSCKMKTEEMKHKS